MAAASTPGQKADRAVGLAAGQQGEGRHPDEVRLVGQLVQRALAVEQEHDPEPLLRREEHGRRHVRGAADVPDHADVAKAPVGPTETVSAWVAETHRRDALLHLRSRGR